MDISTPRENGLLAPAPTDIRRKSYSSIREPSGRRPVEATEVEVSYSDVDRSGYIQSPKSETFPASKSRESLAGFQTPPSTVSSRKSSRDAVRLALEIQETHLQKQLDSLPRSPPTSYIPRSPSTTTFSDRTPLSQVPQYHSTNTNHQPSSPPQAPLPPLPPTPTAPTEPYRSIGRRMTSNKGHPRLSATYEDVVLAEEEHRALSRQMVEPEERRNHWNEPRISNGMHSGVSLRQDAPTDQYGRKVLQTDIHGDPERLRPNVAAPDDNASDYEDVLHDSYAKTDLTSWAPAHNPKTSVASSIANLPDWSQLEDGGLTSLPNRAIQRDIDYTLRKLLNIQVFEQLLEDPLGRHRFRDFLVSEGASTAELDMYMDVLFHAHLIEQLRSSAEALQDLYLTPGSSFVRLPHSLQREAESALRKNHAKPAVSLDSAQQHLLADLYHNQFQSFVKQKIIEQTHVKLGKNNLVNSNGLGDCFCLTNPRLRDHPIVLVSDGFTGVTGYPRAQIVGRNCRFLQGPGTAPESVDRIRQGLNNGQGCTELLLNYRRDGTPFYCLLCIIPLRDASGQLAYFIGGQTNVTGVFAENKNLSFLITGSSNDDIPVSASGPIQSPAMLEYQRSITVERPGTSMASRRSEGHKSTRTAGMVETFTASEPFALSAMNMRPAPSGGQSMGKIIGRLFKKQSTDLDLASGPVVVASSTQRIIGAEAMLGDTARNLESQLSVFSDVYSKVLVFKKAKREVIFVTRQLLAYLGLPCTSTRDLYSSPLIHSDLVDCVTAGDKSQTKLMRATIKRAIKTDDSLSLDVGLQFANRSIFSTRGDHALKIGVLHLTPLKERDGSVVAYVGVFG